MSETVVTTARSREHDPLLEELAESIASPPRRYTTEVEAHPRRYGRYEVLELIGRGSTGSVYRAFDPATEREVAIKVLEPSPWMKLHSGDCRRRFHREAQAAGGLSHPNIVVIFDIADDYFVMELLPGITLRAMLDEEKRLSLAEALGVLEPIAEALDYAHRKGIIHRDVKPANVMVLPSGQPKLMDFGVAHLEAQSWTAAGECVGTPAYMAPEQIQGERISSSSDLFALGAVAYEMLTGCKAFSASSMPLIIERVLRGTPDSEAAADLPPHCQAALLRVLDKDPAARFETATAFVTALRGEILSAPRRRRTITASFAPMETQDLRSSGAFEIDRPGLRLRTGTIAAGVLALTFPMLASSMQSAPPPTRPQTAPAARSRATLSSEPAGAIVWIDGRPLGRTPLSIETLRAGLHTLRLARPGFAPTEMVLSFPPGDAGPMAVHLQPLTVERPRPIVPPVAAAPPTEADADAIAPMVGPPEPPLDPPRRIDGQSPRFPWHVASGLPAGRVVVTLTVNADGTPSDIGVAEAPTPLFAHAATEAVRTWRFEPARRGGVAVPFRWTVNYRFEE